MGRGGGSLTSASASLSGLMVAQDPSNHCKNPLLSLCPENPCISTLLLVISKITLNLGCNKSSTLVMALELESNNYSLILGSVPYKHFILV